MQGEHLFEFAAGPYRSGELSVVSFRGIEELSRPFRFDVAIRASIPDLASELTGETATLTIRGGDGSRRVIHGIVASLRAEVPREGDEPGGYRVKLVPRLWTLGLSKNMRIFQDLSVPDIVETILAQGQIERRWQLSRTYAARTYCVQYQEADLSFITRLLAEEGLFYYIDAAAGEGAAPGSGIDTVVLGDDSAHYEPIVGAPALGFHESYGPGLGREHVAGFASHPHIRAGSTLLAGFDFQRSATDVGPPEAVRVGGKGVARPSSAGEKETTLVGIGRSSSARLHPGRWFELEEHPNAALNRRYAIMRVEHEGRGPGAGAGATGAAAAGSDRGESYRNRFCCVDAGIAGRPTRPKRRFRQVVEAATVVGPENEESNTDYPGRIKVQFHWDREGEEPNKLSSCWIRSKQPSATSALGGPFVPRLGMKVMVTLIVGGTDRPILLGGA
jgi:type VI secretion system secreted protein VgrG